MVSKISSVKLRNSTVTQTAKLKPTSRLVTAMTSVFRRPVKVGTTTMAKSCNALGKGQAISCGFFEAKTSKIGKSSC